MRYINFEYGLQSLKSGEFKVTRPLDANDPYEMLGSCKGRFSGEVRQQICNDMAIRWGMEVIKARDGKIIMPLEKVLCDTRNGVEQALRRIICERTTFQEEEKYLCFVDSDCVTTDSDQLMWSHYGECGKGIRIWFDEKELAKIYPVIEPIRYLEQRPVLDFNKVKVMYDQEVMGKFIIDCYFAKSKAWEYEHEKRLMVCRNVNPDLLVKRGEFEFIRIPAAVVKRVDFGPKGMHGETMAAVTRLRNEDKFRHIDFRVAHFIESTYAYEYITIPPEGKAI